MFPELKRLIEQMGKDRGIDKNIIIEALEAAMLNAARKKLGMLVDIEAHYNEEAGEIEVFQFKTVEEKVVDPEMQLSSKKQDERLMKKQNRGTALVSRIDTSTFRPDCRPDGQTDHYPARQRRRAR